MDEVLAEAEIVTFKPFAAHQALPRAHAIADVAAFVAFVGGSYGGKIVGVAVVINTGSAEHNEIGGSGDDI